MNGKIAFMAGAGVGYVLGTRDGRQRYEQIKTKAQDLWGDPKVRSTVDQVVDQAAGVAGTAASRAGDVAAQAKDKVTGDAESGGVDRAGSAGKPPRPRRAAASPAGPTEGSTP